MAYRLQRRLVDEFVAWGSKDDAERDRIAVLLQLWADAMERPDPTRWRSGDIHELFMKVVPRRVDTHGLTGHGLGTLREFLRFLDVTDRLHATSTRPAALLKELDRLTAKFPAAMADPSRPEPETATEEAKPEQVKPKAQREPPPLDGVSKSPLLRDLATFAAWVGPDGRQLDDRGELRKADRPALFAALGRTAHNHPADRILTPLWLIAIEFDVTQLRRTRIVRGPGATLADEVLAGTASPQEALGLWADLADVLVHPARPLHPEKGTEPLRRWIEPWGPLFLDLLATTDGPQDLQELTDRLLREQAGRLPGRSPERFAGIAATAIRNTLAALARHGAVTVVVPTAADPEAEAQVAALGTAIWALRPVPGITVELTELGRHMPSIHSTAAVP